MKNTTSVPIPLPPTNMLFETNENELEEKQTHCLRTYFPRSHEDMPFGNKRPALVAARRSISMRHRVRCGHKGPPFLATPAAFAVGLALCEEEATAVELALLPLLEQHTAVKFCVGNVPRDTCCYEMRLGNATPFHIACAYGNEVVVQRMVDIAVVVGRVQHMFTRKNAGGQLPIHYAALGGHAKIVSLIVNTAAATSQSDAYQLVQSRCKQGYTLVHYAAAGGSRETLDTVCRLYQQAEPELVACYDHEPLNVPSFGSGGFTPLHFALQRLRRDANKFFRGYDVCRFVSKVDCSFSAARSRRETLLQLVTEVMLPRCSKTNLARAAKLAALYGLYSVIHQLAVEAGKGGFTFPSLNELMPYCCRDWRMAAVVAEVVDDPTLSSFSLAEATKACCDNIPNLHSHATPSFLGFCVERNPSLACGDALTPASNGTILHLAASRLEEADMSLDPDDKRIIEEIMKLKQATSTPFTAVTKLYTVPALLYKLVRELKMDVNEVGSEVHGRPPLHHAMQRPQCVYSRLEAKAQAWSHLLTLGAALDTVDTRTQRSFVHVFFSRLKHQPPSSQIDLIMSLNTPSATANPRGGSHIAKTGCSFDLGSQDVNGNTCVHLWFQKPTITPAFIYYYSGNIAPAATFLHTFKDSLHNVLNIRNNNNETPMDLLAQHLYETQGNLPQGLGMTTIWNAFSNLMDGLLNIEGTSLHNRQLHMILTTWCDCAETHNVYRADDDEGAVKRPQLRFYLGGHVAWCTHKTIL